MKNLQSTCYLRLVPSLALLPVCGLFTSCADEDMAMFGAIATGTAAAYADANGASESAAGLRKTQQDILLESSRTEAANDSAARSSAVYGTPVQGEPGYVFSPHSGKKIDVKGIAANTLVKDPNYQGDGRGYFRVPPGAVSMASSSTSPEGKASAMGIAGTWSNASATWRLNSDGTATVTIPSTNQNGTATTYLSWSADDSGKFDYTITRATLTGSLNCNGTYDYDKPVNKSFSETYRLNGSTLTIGREVLQRN